MFETDATSLTRLINCNGSASMAVFKAAIENANTIVRDEGIAAHYMSVRLNHGDDDNSLIGSEAPNGVFMTEEMLYAVGEYLDYINGRNAHFSEMEFDLVGIEPNKAVPLKIGKKLKDNADDNIVFTFSSVVPVTILVSSLFFFGGL